MTTDNTSPRLACRHSIPRGRWLDYSCSKCGAHVVPNGCGEGWVTLDELSDPDSGWRLGENGQALWMCRDDR